MFVFPIGSIDRLQIVLTALAQKVGAIPGRAKKSYTFRKYAHDILFLFAITRAVDAGYG